MFRHASGSQQRAASAAQSHAERQRLMAHRSKCRPRAGQRLADQRATRNHLSSTARLLLRQRAVLELPPAPQVLEQPAREAASTITATSPTSLNSQLPARVAVRDPPASMMPWASNTGGER
jgi:hypothetical protein